MTTETITAAHHFQEAFLSFLEDEGMTERLDVALRETMEDIQEDPALLSRLQEHMAAKCPGVTWTV